VCGCPLVTNVFEETGDFCRASKRRCLKHYSWEKLRRAEIDLQRIQQVEMCSIYETGAGGLIFSALRIQQSSFESCPGPPCCVLGWDYLLSPRPSPSRLMCRCQRIFEANGQTASIPFRGVPELRADHATETRHKRRKVSALILEVDWIATRCFILFNSINSESSDPRGVFVSFCLVRGGGGGGVGFFFF